MKTIYLKNENYNKIGNYNYALKIMDNGKTIDCDGESINTSEFSSDFQEEVDYHFDRKFFKLTEASREEFDSLYKKTVEKINHLINI